MFDELLRTTLSFVVLGLLLAWESFRPFFAHFDGNLRERGWHGLRNLGLGILNAGLNGLFCAGLWLVAASVQVLLFVHTLPAQVRQQI